jgi:hypothetical protein
LAIAGALVGFPYFYVLMFPYALVMLYMVKCRMPKKVQTALNAHLIELESDCGVKVEAVYYAGDKAQRARITFVKTEGSGPAPVQGKFVNVKKEVVKSQGSLTLRQIEADIFNDKRSIYVFDDKETTYVVIEVRGCAQGQPLLPIADGDKSWSPPEDRYQQFADYLVQCMWLLYQQDWTARILPHIEGKNLARYQAAVREEDWRTLWDALLKPFAEMRLVYRGVYKCRRAPDLFFGVNARFVHTNYPTADESTVLGHRSALPERDPELSDLNDGVHLPTAAEWLDFWSHQDIPQRRTFIEFASDLGRLPLLPRSNSVPDLKGTTNSNEEEPLSSCLRK